MYVKIKEKGIFLGNKNQANLAYEFKVVYVTVFALQIVLTFCPLLLHSAYYVYDKKV